MRLLLGQRDAYTGNSGITKKGAESQPGEREVSTEHAYGRRLSINNWAARRSSWVGREEQGKCEGKEEEGEFGNWLEKLHNTLYCPYETFHIARTTAIWTQSYNNLVSVAVFMNTQCCARSSSNSCMSTWRSVTELRTEPALKAWTKVSRGRDGRKPFWVDGNIWKKSQKHGHAW